MSTTSSSPDKDLETILFIIQNIKYFIGFGSFFVTIIFGLLVVIGRGFTKGFSAMEDANKEFSGEITALKEQNILLQAALANAADHEQIVGAKIDQLADKYHHFATNIDKELKDVDRSCFTNAESIKRLDQRIDDLSLEQDKADTKCDQRHGVTK